MGEFSEFERGQIVGACLAEASMTHTVTLLGVSKGYVGTHESWEDKSAKRNSGRESTMAERDRRALRIIVSKNRKTNAAQVNCSRIKYSS
jgi:hypothetical protein